MAEEKAVKETKKDEPTFSKKDLLESKKYRTLKDVVNTVLDKDTQYTLQEAEDKINAFLKGGK